MTASGQYRCVFLQKLSLQHQNEPNIVLDKYFICLQILGHFMTFKYSSIPFFEENQWILSDFKCV